MSNKKPEGVIERTEDVDLAPILESVSWGERSLFVADPDRVNGNKERGIYGIRRANLSASTAENVRGCPARFALDSLLPQAGDPLAANNRGTIGHSILEKLYEQPSEKRTLTSLRRKVKPAIRRALTNYEGTPDYDDYFQELLKSTGAWVENIFQMEDPTQVRIFRNEMKFKGIMLPNGVPGTGYLDRVTWDHPDPEFVLGEIDPDNPVLPEGVTLRIEDYKFTNKVKRPSPMFGDSYGDQMRIYNTFLKALLGVEAQSATLLFVRQAKPLKADLSKGATRATLASFRKSWDDMNAYADKQEFPCRPSALCGWCPAANSCPVSGEGIKSDKAKDHAATLFGGTAEGAPTALPIPTLRDGARPAVTKPEVLRMDEVDETQEVIMSSVTQLLQAVKSKNTVEFPTNSSKWGVAAASQVVETAVSHLSVYAQPINGTTVTHLSSLLAGTVESVVRDVFGGGFDWTFETASRVVYSLKETLRSAPAPFGADAEAWERWHGVIRTRTAVKVRVTMELFDVSGFDAPDYAALAGATTLPEHTRNPDSAALIAESESVPA